MPRSGGFRHRTRAAEHLSATRDSSLRRRRRSAIIWEQKGFNYDPTEAYSDPILTLNPMNIACENCDALRFPNESDGLCCAKGKVIIPRLENPPLPIQRWLFEDSPVANFFRRSTIMLNSLFQMTSFGAKQIVSSGFFPTFKISGQLYHRIGDLLPLDGSDPKFLQIYFYGTDEQKLNARLNIAPISSENEKVFQREIVIAYQEVLSRSNNLIACFSSILERQENVANYTIG